MLHPEPKYESTDDDHSTYSKCHLRFLHMSHVVTLERALLSIQQVLIRHSDDKIYILHCIDSHDSYDAFMMQHIVQWHDIDKLHHDAFTALWPRIVDSRHNRLS